MNSNFQVPGGQNQMFSANAPGFINQQMLSPQMNMYGSGPQTPGSVPGSVPGSAAAPTSGPGQSHSPVSTMGMTPEAIQLMQMQTLQNQGQGGYQNQGQLQYQQTQAQAQAQAQPPDDLLQKRIALILDINVDLLELVMNAPKEGGPDSLFVGSMKRLQSNLAYLASLADKSKANRVAPFPHILTAPQGQGNPVLELKYERLRGLA